MKRFLFVAALLLVSPAFAQTYGTGNVPTGPAWMSYDSNGNLKVTTTGGGGGAGSGAPVVPPGVTGFGTLAATNSSTLLSTITAGPNSAAWPTSPGQVWVLNSGLSADAIFVCPLGGTCSTTVGIRIPVGGGYGFYQPATAMTVFAVSTATVTAQW